MFTDQPVTPVRLEVLLSLLVHYESGLKKGIIYDLLQPDSLPPDRNKNTSEKVPNKHTSEQVLKAATQLGLAEENHGIIKLTKDYDKSITVNNNILNAFDKNVLSNLKIEPYFALFYAYYLGLNKKAYKQQDYTVEKWVSAFNKDVFNNELPKNPFNKEKFAPLNRWVNYLGLGWYDSSEQFQANPYERLLRSLPKVFGNNKSMQGDKFMDKLAIICPELDGGEIFCQANKYRNYNPKDKQCTLGLSHALVDLHEDNIIVLVCPGDSPGWNISLAQPPRDDSIKSDRITMIEYVRK